MNTSNDMWAVQPAETVNDFRAGDGCTEELGELLDWTAGKSRFVKYQGK